MKHLFGTKKREPSPRINPQASQIFLLAGIFFPFLEILLFCLLSKSYVFVFIFFFEVGIYWYTLHAVKQETFLEEIDEEMAVEHPATHGHLAASDKK